MKIVFLGDVVAKSGRRVVKKYINTLKEKYQCDIFIVNGENAAGGIGITKETAEELFFVGVDIITTGNHVWKHKEAHSYLEQNSNKIIRPLNYPNSKNFTVPGSGYTIFKSNAGSIVVINILGRTFLESVDNPFLKVEELLDKLKEYKIKIIDFHAETTSEKVAMGWFLDGKVSAVVGTHTHVQTSDERILPNGTAYITDLGMCGAIESVIGVDKDIIIQKFTTGLPVSFKFPESSAAISGVFIDIDDNTGKAKKIERIYIGE